jgi:aminoglycoside 3-N-acetyltransferase
MEEKKLFQCSKEEWVTNKSMLETLLAMGADQCDTLYIHTSLNFGIPNRELKNKGIMEEMLKVLKALNVKTICMPTYTFSYPNGKVYNPQESKSRMGVFNEFFRVQEGVIRSNDPLMSVALLGEDKGLAYDISTHSTSENSTFDLLHHRDHVKFLFLGAQLYECFTYMHYLEWLYSVDYRYIRAFKGKSVIDGREVENEYDLFVRHKGVTPNSKTFDYEQRLLQKGVAQKRLIGNGSVTLVDEKLASEVYKQCLLDDPYFFVDIEGDLHFRDKTFSLNGEMVSL